MAVYQIFPEKDATIYSDLPTINTGISEILDLSKIVSDIYPSGSGVGRVLIKFDDSDLDYLFNAYIGSSSFSASIKLYSADASVIPLEYDLECYAISGAWDMGTGRIDNVPYSIDGVSWQYMTTNPVGYWRGANFSTGVTASYYTASNPGGGTWYTSSLTTQSFDNRSGLDISLDVTTTINQFLSGSIENDGFIIKNSFLIEFDPNYSYKLTYFSVDTNTIYPPLLEVKWDDSSFIPNTSSMSVVSNNAVVTLGNNKGIFSPGSVARFNVNVRDQFPARVFVTSSLFTVGKYLPSSSYYSLVDLDTNNIIFDFDENFTKISCDQYGSYFNLYMSGLEPNRYYKLRIKVVNDGEIDIYDNDYYFKVSQI